MAKRTVVHASILRVKIVVGGAVLGGGMHMDDFLKKNKSEIQ